MSTQPTITPEDLLAHSAWLQRLACRMVDPNTAEDLVQETWATAVRAAPGRDRPLRPWLAEVLRNLVFMRTRGQGRWQRRTPLLAATADHPLPTPEELLTYHEAQRLVASVVAELEEPYRSTVLLCYAQDIPAAEIARRQGIPAGTVRWRLKRGLDQLRAQLDARYGNDRQAWTLALIPLTRTTSSPAPGPAPLLPAAAAATAIERPARFAHWVMGLAAAAVGIVAFTTLRPNPDGANVRARGDSQAAPTALARLGADPAVPRLAAAAAGPAAPAGAPTPPATPPAAGAPVGAATAVDPEEAKRRAIDPADSPMRGNPAAPVTIVMWAEFQCPFSKRLVDTFREVEATYPQDVRIVWKHVPLAFHEAAFLASEAALAAHEQGKFWPMHDRLFAQQERLDPAAIDEHAAAVGLDMKKFKAAIDTGKFKKRVETDMQIARDAKIMGTPTAWVNGEKVVGSLPFEAWKKHIDVALARARGLPAPATTAPEATASKTPGPPRMPPPGSFMAGDSPYWPPPPITVPDRLLGRRLALKLDIGKAPQRGNPKGPVEIVCFTPFMPPSKWIIDGLLATYKDHVRVIAKGLPRISKNERSTTAAEAALFAHAEGKFWEMHDALSTPPFMPDQPERTAIEAAAKRAGLDAADLAAALDAGRFRAAVEADDEQQRAAGIKGPAYLVNGRLAESTVALVQLVESEIKKAGRQPPPRPTPKLPVPTTPGQPGYNLHRLLNHLTAQQFFAQEVRDDAWAGGMERTLGPLVESDVRAVEPRAQAARIECRSTVCRISWKIGKGDENAVSFLAGKLYGDISRPPVPGEVVISARTDPGKSADDTVARIKSKRSTVLFNHRTGRTTAALPFPIARLPKE